MNADNVLKLIRLTEKSNKLVGRTWPVHVRSRDESEQAPDRQRGGIDSSRSPSRV